jgi:hypothetical protein
MDESKTARSDAPLPVPTAREHQPISGTPSTATLAPEEFQHEKDVDDVASKDGTSPAALDPNDDANYFHGMELMPVFIALILAIFLIAIDQVC